MVGDALATQGSMAYSLSNGHVESTGPGLSYGFQAPVQQ